LASFGTIAVHAYDRHQWSVQRPEHIWLCHRPARRIAIVGTEDRRLSTKVTNEGLQARFACSRVYIAVMVPRDGHNWGVIIEIRFIKLGPVICAFSVVIHSCATADRAPDAVLTGHVHNYQRFSAPLYNKKNVPFIVAGAGGYNKRLHVLGRVFHEAKLPIQIRGEPEYLEKFNDSQHGYLRITVEKKITLDYVAVPDPSENVRTRC
jgi:hypothetical protein